MELNLEKKISEMIEIQKLLIDKLGRDKTLKTLGNLTLVTQPLNSKLRNNKWSKKKKDLKKNSHLSITRDFVEIEEWNEQEILSRGKYLAKQALLVWQR